MIFRVFLTLILLGFSGLAAAQTAAPSTGSPTASVDQKTVNNTSVGFQNGVVQLVTDHAQSWTSTVCDYIGNVCVFLLFKFYDKFVGKFLLSLPDMSNPATYDFAGGAQGAAAAGVITSVSRVFSALGLYLFAVFFTVYIATSSSGFSSTPLRPEGVLRLPLTMILLFAWPVIFSILSNSFAALTDLIYSQNTLTTTGVFEGLKNISLNQMSATNPNQVSNLYYGGATPHKVFLNNAAIIWNVVYFFGIAFITLGVIFGAAMFSGGKFEGKSRILWSIVGLLILLSVPSLVYFMVNKGVDTLGSPNALEPSTFNSQGLINGAGTSFQPGPGVQTAIPEGTPTTIGDAVTQAFETNAAIVGGAILKVLISLSGIVIVMLVIMAKFFQILSLFFIFLFGPVFIGFLGHPSTQHIATKAAWLVFKTFIYNPVWAVLLIGLYIVPNINFGLGGLGVNSLLTGFAVLTALKMIQNASEWVSMFTTQGALSFSGSKWNEPLQQMASVAGGVASFAAASTGPTGQALATAAGSGLGSMFGPAVAAKMGGMALGMSRTTNFLSAATAKVAGGRLDQASQTTHTAVSNYLQQTAGDFLGRKAGSASPEMASYAKSLREAGKKDF